MAEPLHQSSVIVIHPGSYWLRIGRASDPYPVAIPQVIARRNHGMEKDRFEEKLLHRNGIGHSGSCAHREQALKMVEQAIWSRKTSQGHRRESVHTSEVHSFNDSVSHQSVDEFTDMSWTDTANNAEYFIGDQALYLENSSDYNIQWPMKHGQLNLHNNVGGSISAVIQDLCTLWGHVLDKSLGIPPGELEKYRAILLIPDIYHRPHIKELVKLLLIDLRFEAAIVHQESVCATYGSGLCSACVVDVGDQKTSVCCVEDGLSHRNTRVCMTYGGKDITRTFTWLLEKARFPYRECKPETTMDALLLIELKETFCHLDQDFDGIQILDFQVCYPNQPMLTYQMKLGDETLQAPMAIFYPQLFGVVDEKMTFTQQRNQGDPEDINDELYLLQTQNQQQQATKLKTDNGVYMRDDQAGLQTGLDGLLLGSVTQRTSSPLIGQCQGEMLMQAEEAPPPIISRRISTSQTLDKPLGLDQAILYSIDCCASDETKKKMYSCILVVGGGVALFQGAAEMLQQRIQTKMPPSFRRAVDRVEVICKSKEQDPRVTCWKGGAVLSYLDTTQELWISRTEWEREGLKLLRERSPFVW
ncbi:actin-related protein 8-like isoform X2 [Lytechinus variegatus]|uniref:actin-related protein 8-like isoform X2 n=1 Tax=Lytechinus variegatus TaxID=7654 RepID=UPI001BB1F465|nr:actin-related protein 8-like isoform X2 [Lytechinus variegatus]